MGRTFPTSAATPVMLENLHSITGKVRPFPADPQVSSIAPPPAATAEMVNHLTLTTSATDALTDCDLALLLTDWPEFATLNWSRIASQMRGNVVIDTRNQLDPDSLEAAGLRLHSTGIRAGKSVQLRPPEQTISAP